MTYPQKCSGVGTNAVGIAVVAMIVVDFVVVVVVVAFKTGSKNRWPASFVLLRVVNISCCWIGLENKSLSLLVSWFEASVATDVIPLVRLLFQHNG